VYVPLQVFIISCFRRSNDLNNSFSMVSCDVFFHQMKTTPSNLATLSCLCDFLFLNIDLPSLFCKVEILPHDSFLTQLAKMPTSSKEQTWFENFFANSVTKRHVTFYPPQN
jgi:hypothetical protein